MSAANGTGGDVATLQLIRAAELAPWPDLNPRRRFDEQKHQELVASIRRGGVHQPLVVHPVQHEYWVIAGERRMRAAKAIGGDTLVPCMVREYSEDEALEIALIENMDRDDLTPIEEARGFKRLLEQPGMTQKKLAERIGRTQPYISNRIRLLELPDEILTLVEDGRLTATIARDSLLRFLAVPEPYRGAFFAAVAAELSKSPNEDDYDDAEGVISDVARNRSRSLKANQYGADVPVFSLARHKKCDCGAPEIDFGGWRGKEKRCWNLEWWDAEQKRAKADKRKREKRAAEREIEKAGAMGGLQVFDDRALHTRYGSTYSPNARIVTVATHDGHFARAAGFNGRDVFDLGALDRESLIVAKGWGGRYELVSTDVKGVASAREAFERQVQARVKAEAKKRAAQDLEIVRSPSAAAWRETATVARALLRAGNALYRLNDLARELGFKPTNRSVPLDGLSAEQMMDTIHVAVLRSRRHDTPGVVLTENVIRDEMATPHREALLALIPWEIEPEEDLEDEEFEDDDLDDDQDADDSTEAQLLDGRIRIDTSDHDAYCLLCECTDSHACEGGCTWLAVDREAGVGVCSQCAESEEEAKETLAAARAA